MYSAFINQLLIAKKQNSRNNYYFFTIIKTKTMTKGSISQRFLFAAKNIRGEYLTLDDQWQIIQKQQDYPERVRFLLGEALACAILISSTLKYHGRLTLQIQNPAGKISLLVVQVTSDHTFRATANWSGDISEQSLPELFGQTQLVITLEQNQQNHQAIVALEGNSISQCIERYFIQSEQLDTRIWLAQDSDKLSALLLQKLPDNDNDQDQNDWDEAVMIAQTLSDKEMLQWDTPTLLHHLYPEEDFKLFDSQFWRFACSCSREKIKNMVRSLGEKEADKILKEKGVIAVECEFCHQRYQLDTIDTATLFRPEIKTASELH